MTKSSMWKTSAQIRTTYRHIIQKTRCRVDAVHVVFVLKGLAVASLTHKDTSDNTIMLYIPTFLSINPWDIFSASRNPALKCVAGPASPQ